MKDAVEAYCRRNRASGSYCEQTRVLVFTWHAMNSLDRNGAESKKKSLRSR
jgi:hypothetical protein